jgi:hypothetical protein
MADHSGDRRMHCRAIPGAVPDEIGGVDMIAPKLMYTMFALLIVVLLIYVVLL